MAINFGTGQIIVTDLWPTIRDTCISKSLSLQYVDDSSVSGGAYSIFTIDDEIAYSTTIFKGTVPTVADVSQSQNDTYKSDFENNYKSKCNYPINFDGDFNDPRMIRVLGNLTTASVNEVLVSVRPYTEPGSQAQRSVVSTNANDTNPSGTGAKQVRITYLNSNYVLNTEDVFVSGTTPVNTVNTDIRFIQSFQVIKGSAAVGAVKLMSSTGGGGTEICGIGAGSLNAFLSHYYVPSGSYVHVFGWGATVDSNASLKLTGQQYFNNNLIDNIIDLEKMSGPSGPITTPGQVDFYRQLRGIRLDPKTYVRVTCAPSQSSNTTVRAFMELWQTIGPTG